MNKLNLPPRPLIGVTVLAVCAILPACAASTDSATRPSSQRTGQTAGPTSGSTDLARLSPASGDSVEPASQRAPADSVVERADEIGTDVMFRTDDDGVAARSVGPLLKLGALAASMSGIIVRVSGHADARGSERLNDALSARRAQAVAAVLAKSGLPEDRMIVEARGRSDATAAEGDVDGYALDRLVTVRLEKVAASVARNE